MGQRGVAAFTGARSVGTLDTDTALALATDDELAEEVESAGVSAAKEKAQVAAPDMVDQLVGIAKHKLHQPSARVSAAREVLHQAEGRPATQKDNQVQGNLTVVLANFTVEGRTTEAIRIPRRPPPRAR